MAPSTIKNIPKGKRSGYLGTMAKIKIVEEIQKRLGVGEGLMKVLKEYSLEKNTFHDWASTKNKHERIIKGNKKMSDFFVKVKKESIADA